MMRRVMLLSVAALLVALSLVASCAAPGDRRDLATMTSVPRTARPTRTTAPSPTPTGTIAPTPTLNVSGFHVYDVSTDTDADCALAATTMPDIGLTETFTGSGIWGKTVRICSFDRRYDGVTVTLSGYATGQLPDAIAQGTFGCDINAIRCSPTANNFTTGQSDETSGGCALSNMLAPLSSVTTIGKVGDPVANEYEIELNGYGFINGPCGDGELSYTITLAGDYWDATPGPTPTLVGTPTPSGVGNCWITEIFSKQSGSGKDWNLRDGAGTDDQFVEIACNPAQSLAGWTIGIDDYGEYEIYKDNLTGPLKVYWNDYWPDYDSATSTFPLTSTVRLTNTLGTLIDSRAYETLSYGNSWAAAAWTNPEGVWWYYSPSPGWGGEYMPTLTPTP